MEQQQSRDTQFNMQDESINERTQLTNVNTSNYNPGSFTDSNMTAGSSNGNSNGDAGGGRITDNGLPPTMGLEMHNLISSSPVSTTNDQNATNGNHNEINPTTTNTHSDVNISLVANDNRNIGLSTDTNGGVNRNVLNRIRRGIRYFRPGRGNSLHTGGDALNPKA